MKTAFIAYRHTGEDPAVLEPILSTVRDGLARLSIEAYCTFFHEDEFQNKGMDARAIMEHAFATIEDKDFLFVIQAAQDKSEGMLMEVGRFFARKPIVVAKHASVIGTYVPDMADVSYEWSTTDELAAGIPVALSKLAD